MAHDLTVPGISNSTFFWEITGILIPNFKECFLSSWAEKYSLVRSNFCSLQRIYTLTRISQQNFDDAVCTF